MATMRIMKTPVRLAELRARFPYAEWHRVARGRRADRGHTVLFVGYSMDGTSNWNRVKRYYVACQCGKVRSGQTADNAYYGMRRHQMAAWVDMEEE